MTRTPAGLFPRGFTLVEMLVVVAVLALLLGGLLVPLSKRLEVARYERVAEQLETAREALIGFAAANGNRLPCPDTGPEGQPNPLGAGACDQPEGFLPHATLGLPELDPWGNRLRYRPDRNLVPAAGLGGPPPVLLDNLQVLDRGVPVVQVRTAANTVAAVLFSCGPDGRADEENNGDDSVASVARCADPAAPLDPIYVEDAATTTDVFDDALVWLTTHSLATRLAAAGLWPR